MHCRRLACGISEKKSQSGCCRVYLSGETRTINEMENIVAEYTGIIRSYFWLTPISMPVHSDHMPVHSGHMPVHSDHISLKYR